jgi:branched-chain amino acid transport system permease protein
MRLTSKHILFLFIFGAVMIAPLVSDFMTRVLIDIFLYAFLGIAWNISGGFAGQGSFGHSVFFGLGAYGAAILLLFVGITPWIGLFFGALMAVCLALLIGFLSFRLGISGSYFFLITVAISEGFRLLFDNLDQVGGSLGLYIPIVATNRLYYMQFGPGYTVFYYIFFALLIAGLLLSVMIKKSKFGYFLFSIREDEVAAESMGIATMKYKLIALCVSALLTAIAGSFFTFYVLYISPDSVMTLSVSLLIVLVVAVGGIGTIEGPILGAAIVLPIEDVVSAYFGGIAGLGELMIGLFLIVIAVSRPGGMVELFNKLMRSVAHE